MIDAHIELPDGEDSIRSLENVLEFSGISGMIVVQREPGLPNHRKIHELIQKSNDWLCGVVAWAPLDNAQKMNIQLNANKHESMICGYLADIHDKRVDHWIHDEDVQHGMTLLSSYNKPLDLLTTAEQMFEILPFLDAHPDSLIVLDHCFGNHAIPNQDWTRLMRELSKRPHVFYRLSGLATAAKATTAYEATTAVKETFLTAMHAFGPHRMLYGSGWPITPARYPIWLNTVDNLIHSFSADEQTAITHKNAQMIYGL